MAEHTVALQVIEAGEDKAIDALAGVLDDAEVGTPDATGILEVTVEADDFEAALTTVWNGIAAAGADDKLAFAEHPDIPEHWRERTA
jgi:uncharacterized protein (UPF0261 family)